MFRLVIFLLALTMNSLGGCGQSGKVEKSSEAKEEKTAEANTTMKRVGPGLAVEGYDPAGRIKLSEKAVRRLELSTAKAGFLEGAVRINADSVMEDKGQSFVYVQEPDGWMKRVSVKIGPRSGAQIPILSGLAVGTTYVNHGAALVRLAELDLISGDEAE